MRHLALVPLLAACVNSSAAPGTEPPAETQLGGTYKLANRIDLASAGVLPDLASSTLESLSKLKEDPAGAIISILQNSHAPVISTLLSALPSVIKDQLASFIDDYVFAAVFQGVPVTAQIAGVIDDVASLVTRFQLDTQLELAPPDDRGETTATHSVVGVTFTVADRSLVVTAPDLLTQLTRGSCSATALHVVEQSPDVENGILDLHDHAFGLPIGQYVLHGIDQLVQQKLGQPNLRAAVGAIINCAGLAHDVATKCIGPVCVGHETDIKNVCEAGLDAIVDDVESQIAALSLDALRFHDGQALMWDAAMPGGATDGVIDRIDGGVWKLGLDIGTGEHATVADFTGARVADGAQ